MRMARLAARVSRTQTRLFDRLFVGGCTLAYVVLIGSVVAALKMVAH